MKYKVVTVTSINATRYTNHLPEVDYFQLKKQNVRFVYVFERAIKGWKAISKLTINSNGYVVDLYNV